jgi:hypothetical protein
VEPVPRVVKTLHEFGEGAGSATHVPVLTTDRIGQSEAGNGRNNDVESVGWVTAVRVRLCQRLVDFSNSWGDMG